MKVHGERCLSYGLSSNLLDVLVVTHAITLLSLMKPSLTLFARNLKLIRVSNITPLLATLHLLLLLRRFILLVNRVKYADRDGV